MNQASGPPRPPTGRIGALDRRNPMSRVYPGTFLFEGAAGGLRFLLPLALADRGLGPAGIGVVVATFALVSLVSRGAAAGLYRYRRAKPLVLLAGAFSSLGFLLLPLADGLPLYAGLMALDGFGWAIVTTSLLAIVLTHTPRELPSTSAMSWYVGVQGAALASGAIVGGLLAQLIGVWPALVLFAVLPIVAGLLIALGLPRPGTVLVEEHAERAAIEEQRRQADEEISPILEQEPESEPARDHASRSLQARGRARLGRVLRAARELPPAVWSAAVVAAYLNVMNSLLQSFFPLLGVASGMSLAQVGTLSGMRTAISSGARFAAAWVFERIDARRLHLPLLTTSALSVMLLPMTAASFLLTLPLMAFSGISRGLLRVTTGAAAMDALSGRRAGPAAAVMTAGLDVGKIVGPLIGGFVASLVGLEAMFVIVPLAFLLVAYAGALAGRHRRAGDPAVPGA